MEIHALDWDRPKGAGETSGHTIRTYTGLYVDPFNMDHDLISIVDIGHHLAYQCRFAGAVQTFYSVGQHSLNVAHMVLRMTGRKDWALVGLLHDSEEAYLPDMVRPVKHRADMRAYVDAGEALRERIMGKYDVSGEWQWVMEHIVKDVDDQIVSWEMAMYRDQQQVPAAFEWVEVEFVNKFYEWSMK